MQSGTSDPTLPPAIDCETAVRRLWDYLDGRLPAMSHREVEAHLASCELCPPHFAFAADMRKALAASSESISSEEEARLRLRVRGALERVTANGADDASQPR